MSTFRGQHLIGKMLGSCVLERLLGYGGSSAVFLARQSEPPQQVAIKVFLPRPNLDAYQSQNFQKRFLHEAKAASELNHPNILPILAYGEEEDLTYLIMPYVPGGTLYEYVNRHGRLSLHEASLYLEQIAAALDYAHEHGRIHCDVKPANLLLDGEGNVLLTDFGIARLLATEDSPAEQLSGTSEALMGTPDYISPEQALGQPLDGRSDIYSLGVTLFFLLAGHPPFMADSTIAMALLHVHEPPPSLGDLYVHVPPQIDYVIHKALAKFPDERYQTAGQLSKAFQEGFAHTGKPGQLPGSNRRWRMRLARRTPPPLRRLAAAPARLRPAWNSLGNVSKALLFGLTLLVVMVGTSVSAGLITTYFTHLAPNRASSQLSNLTGDALADRLLYGESDWPQSSTFFFANGQYHIQNKSPQDIALALYANHTFTNFQLSVTLRELHGSRDGADFYGVVLRSNTDQSQYYVFEVDSWGGGQFEFLRYDGHWKTLVDGSLTSFHSGAGQTNTLDIKAHARTFDFFVNGQRAGTAVTDTSKQALASGNIGLYVEEEGTEVLFSHLLINSST